MAARPVTDLPVSGIIVTRGNVDLEPCLATWPTHWEWLVWDNGAGLLTRRMEGAESTFGVPDVGVYGRWAAARFTVHPLIYVQDDDVVVDEPAAIADAWAVSSWARRDQQLVANMPPEFRHDGYIDSCLVGFGAVLMREAVDAAFARFQGWVESEPASLREADPEALDRFTGLFRREADTIVTTLTPRILVDVAKTNRGFASEPDRLWKQPGHAAARREMLEYARQARDWEGG